MYLPSNVSKCGSPPPLADILSQYWPSHPPKHSHLALQFGAMAGFPLPEQSKNDKRYLISCQFDSRKTESEEKARTQTSSIDHALNSQTNELPLGRSLKPILPRPSQNQNSIKAQLQVAGYVDIYPDATNCNINCSTTTLLCPIS